MYSGLRSIILRRLLLIGSFVFWHGRKGRNNDGTTSSAEQDTSLYVRSILYSVQSTVLCIELKVKSNMLYTK